MPTGQFFQSLQRLAPTPFNILQSYALFGALLMLALWNRVCRNSRSRPAASSRDG